MGCCSAINLLREPEDDAGVNGFSATHLANSGLRPRVAALRRCSPSYSCSPPVGASHNRIALSIIASNTGWVSVGELLMTFRISAVAVCCSSASVTSALRACSSLNSRTFSMAITAWLAKVLIRSICFCVNARTSRRLTTIAPTKRPSFSMGTARRARIPFRSTNLQRPTDSPSR